MILKVIKTYILDKFTITADQLLLIELVTTKDYIGLDSLIDTLKGQYDVLMQNLYRRNFIDFKEIENPVNYKKVENIFITTKGEEVIAHIKDVLEGLTKNQQIPIVSVEANFDEFWTLFPSSDKWGNFSATRSLKSDKENCRKKYKKLINEEGYKHEDIIKALSYQIALFKKNSTVIDNKMKFFQNSLTWINQRTFIQYLEILSDDENTIQDGAWNQETL